MWLCKLLFFLIWFSLADSDEKKRPTDEDLSRIKSYINFLHSNEVGSCANFKKGMIEIVSDLEQIWNIELLKRDNLLKKGFYAKEAADYSKIGIICQDEYWIWIREGVVFPNGSKGTYNRIIEKHCLDSFGKVAILPVLSDGKIVLNLNYRHATRSWELEIPRGHKKPRESLQEAVFRELNDEMGVQISSHEFLGNMAPDFGILATIVPVYFGKIASIGKARREFSEAILRTVSLTKKEIKEGLKKGYVELEIDKEKQKIPLRDAFLTFALLQAEIRGLL